MSAETINRSENHERSIIMNLLSQLLSTYQPKCPQKHKVEKALVAMKYFRCKVTDT
jgi:hypothetical protein